MSAALDVLDILQVDESSPKKTLLDKDMLLARSEKKKTRQNAPAKRPGNVPREVWGLQSSLKNELPPLMPTDDAPLYKQPKAVIGVGKVRHWRWTPFTNPARQDGLVLYHWRREKPGTDAEEDYQFARYNKHAELPEMYTPSEYDILLRDPKWSEERTAYLLDLAKRFDLRFVHMRDRWDVERFPGLPSVEDLKERFYHILTQLDKSRGTNLSKGLRYDADHERRRKQQLSLLYGRTREQVEEERVLVEELQRIEARRRERERKKQDLQKLISQADSLTRESADQGDGPGVACFDLAGELSVPGGASSSSSLRRRGGVFYAHGAEESTASLASMSAAGSAQGTGDLAAALATASAAATGVLSPSYVINYPEPNKNPGVYLRSQKMKLPSNLGQKKIRIIENFLAHFQIDPNPPATSAIVEAYNNLRRKILHLYDMRVTLLHCDYELQAARLRLSTFFPDLPLPHSLANVTLPANSSETSSSSSAQHQQQQQTAVPASLVEPEILSALRDCDSKRPVLQRYSLGVAGALAAVDGSSSTAVVAAPHTESPVPSSSQSGAANLETAVDVTPGDPVDSGEKAGGGCSADGGRRRRAAALEQGRVLKRLKVKGHLD